MLAAKIGESVLYNTAYIVAVAGVCMGIISWLDMMFAEPVSKANFERAIAAHTETIKAGNAQVVAAVQEGNAQVVAAVADMTRQMSELSSDIRSLLEVRSWDSGDPVPQSDADD